VQIGQEEPPLDLEMASRSKFHGAGSGALEHDGGGDLFARVQSARPSKVAISVPVGPPSFQNGVRQTVASDHAVSGPAGAQSSRIE
jgi:hypothetical protein